MNTRQQARVRAYALASEIVEMMADQHMVTHEGQAVVDEVLRIADSLAWRGERMTTRAAAREQFQARRQRM